MVRYTHALARKRLTPEATEPRIHFPLWRKNKMGRWREREKEWKGENAKTFT